MSVALLDVFNDDEEPHHEQAPEHPDSEQRGLRVGKRPRRHRNRDGAGDTDDERDPLECGVVLGERFCAPIQILAVLPLVLHRAEDVREPMTRAHNLHLFADEQVSRGDLAVEEQVEVCEPAAEHQPEHEGEQHHEREHPDKAPVVAAVEASDGLTHRIDAVGERQQRIDCAEEPRHELDRVQPRGTRNLHDHEQHAEAATDVAERDRERIDNAHVDERGEDSGRHERDGARGLHANDEVSDTHDDRLQHRKRSEQEEATHVGLTHRDVFKALGVHLNLEDHHEHEGTDPERKIREQRCHRGAVGGNGEDGLLIDRHGRGHKLGDLLRVEPRESSKRPEIGGCAECEHVRSCGLHASPHILQVAVKALEGIAGRPQLGADVAEQGSCLVDHGLLRAERSAESPRARRQLGHRGVHLGHRLAQGGSHPGGGTLRGVHCSSECVSRAGNRLHGRGGVGVHSREVAQQLLVRGVLVLEHVQRALQTLRDLAVRLGLGQQLSELLDRLLVRSDYCRELSDRCVEPTAGLGELLAEFRHRDVCGGGSVGEQSGALQVCTRCGVTERHDLLLRLGGERLRFRDCDLHVAEDRLHLTEGRLRRGERLA
ncbi:hypothetical protein ACI1US_01272 [Leucobacter sp. BZR 635]